MIVISILILYCIGVGVCFAILEHIYPNAPQDGLPIIWPILLIFVILFIFPYKITKYILNKL